MGKFKQIFIDTLFNVLQFGYPDGYFGTENEGLSFLVVLETWNTRYVKSLTCTYRYEE